MRGDSYTGTSGRNAANADSGLREGGVYPHRDGRETHIICLGNRSCCGHAKCDLMPG